MALPKGIKVQPSRFAALDLDSDTDSDASDENGGWEVVSGTKTTKPKAKAGGGGGQHKDTSTGAKSLSKSAKKRARKKRNQQNSSEQLDLQSTSKSAGEGQGLSEGDGVVDEELRSQQREAELADLQFQSELEEALLQSKLTAEQEQEIDKQRKAAAALKKQSKKGVKLSLQSLHRGDIISESDTFHQSPKSPKAGAAGGEVAAVNDDSAFFERLGHEAESEMRKRPERKISESQMSPVEESARVAHAMDEVEKRDKTVAALKKENQSLKSQMKEVKERNQHLCKILGQGEFSSKTQLLEQIEELTTVKNELTAEVESLHSNLEQERSRNKALQAEVTKLTSKMGKSRGH